MELVSFPEFYFPSSGPSYLPNFSVWILTLILSGPISYFEPFWRQHLPEWWNYEYWVTFNKIQFYIIFYLRFMTKIYYIENNFRFCFYMYFSNVLLKIPWHYWITMFPKGKNLKLGMNLDYGGRECEVAFCHHGPSASSYINVQPFYVQLGLHECSFIVIFSKVKEYVHIANGIKKCAV